MSLVRETGDTSQFLYRHPLHHFGKYGKCPWFSPTYEKQWKQSFFHVSDYGRSSFRLLLAGLGFLLIWRVSAAMG